ncbi:MAG TPA: proline/glycine betaine ABC transporter substrate-binding protein ProX, partial [Desulfofustis sp.]|nr:proline/glycine betaine ABC transporter substrate-binding protein ProX [Desulfofustis sp.]
MLKQALLGAACAALLATGATSVCADNHKPGDGVTVNPARATWNTGFFQEALVRRGLEELGYKVNAPKDLTNPIFYKSVALGDVDYWMNGWFPMHNAQMPDNFNETATTVDY